MNNIALLLLMLLLSGAQANTEKPKSNLTIVSADVFYAGNFWETPAGKAFWETLEGKLVLMWMEEYQEKIEGNAK